MKKPVWRFESDISAGPIKACNNRSPGNPGIGSNRVQPIRVNPIPARPVRCIHCNLMSKSSPSQSKVRIEIRILFSKPIGEEDNSGGSSGVKCKPTIVSKLPPRNKMIGTVDSIIARAFRLGIGIRSALC